ncbi:MAG: PIN domain-containing protein [Acidobacteria bacterium]|jgi:hypothetical protein|nr:PIN domain-containing protein [Acidobacteriota bacterium]MDP7338305.1 type II toxin-antitoxin system VapC family toxin [Vicinamibacterales bacterium]MDP7481061.1 type II toxin-antitoxin system VapC family toxin [Vicinamibacterales bacterium]HJN45728.1 type II toxin-antitoxin system VapC family toxin [Vicinamibacterales bacterium]|tara:strand:+ start:63 stop:488 length:426 start_codon:yes stop_codon:yes gene_type:complete
MKFWDSSALVPLLVAETSTKRLSALYRREPEIAAWWGTEVECASAVGRLERDGGLAPHDVDQALRRLDALRDRWQEIQPVADVKMTARRFLRVHPLRAADALQLAAAFVASERRPFTLQFVSLDDRLNAAARREGFVTQAT